MIYMAEQFSQEESNLYNSAYVGPLLYQSIREYQTKRESGMHCSLLYLTAPLSLSKRYMDILPQNTTPSISKWASQHEGHLSGFPTAVKSYADIVNSAIAFLLEKELILLEESGLFYVSSTVSLPKLPSYIKTNTTYDNNYRSAGFLGRWFANSASPERVYSQLGVKP